MKKLFHCIRHHRFDLAYALLMASLIALSATPGISIAGDGIAFPYYPAFLEVEMGSGGAKPMPENWQDPKVCMGCHPRQYKGWSTSMHANAFQDPVFQAEWALADKATGGKTLNHCGGCHTPIGIATGTVKLDPSLGKHGGFTAPEIAAKGVSCDVCHTISGTTAAHTTIGDPGNASFIMSPGEVKRATLKDAKSPFHETAYSELHGKAEFCANCHNIFHIDNRFPVEHTYDEWKTSPYAQKGIQCQDCHMVPVDTAIRVANEMKPARDLENHGLGGYAGMGAPTKRDLVHDHGFVGGNTIIAEALGVKGASANKAEAMKRLQNAVDLDFEIVPANGGANLLKVKVTNARAGHNLPTSLTFIRQIWLEVNVTDDQGNVLLNSGVAKDNHLPADAITFTNRSVDKDGKPTINPWEIASFDYQNTIPPKGFRYGVYAFRLPDGAKSFRVYAKLNYQSYAQAVADELLGEGKLTVPIVVMKELTRDYSAADLKSAKAEGNNVAIR
ncbi:MAG: multiheme c-type cytochrome [Thiobacillaceae bacterium]